MAVKNKKDVGVELMRLIGCLIVICCHCVVQYKFDDGYHWPNTFIASMWADGVAIFWLVAGFFMFKNDNMAGKLSNFAKKRLLPALCVGVVFFYFYDFFTSNATILESMTHSAKDYGDIFLGLLKLESPFPKTGHFWYVIVYFLILLIFPAMKGFYDWMIKSPKREYIFMGISLAFLIINDWMKNETFSFDNRSINALVPSCIFVMWGAVLYRHKDLFRGKLQLIFSIVGFFGINMLRALVIVSRNEASEIFWYTGWGLACAICVFTFCLNIGGLMQNNAGGRVVCGIAYFTYMIYLIHYGVKDMLTYWGVKDWVRSVSPPGVPIKVLGYTLIMALLVFTLSFIIAAILHLIKVLAVNIWSRISQKGKTGEGEA